MYIQTAKPKGNQNRSIAHSIFPRKRNSPSLTHLFDDKRTNTATQTKLISFINDKQKSKEISFVKNQNRESVRGDNSTIQRIRVVSHWPDWSNDTRPKVKEEYHAANNITWDFGLGAEEAYRCPGCTRYLPLANATIDHKQPKESLYDYWKDYYPQAPQAWLDWSQITYLSDNTTEDTTGTENKSWVKRMLWNDLDNLEPMCSTCNSSKSSSFN